jgi:hypothetical protein
MSTPSPQFLSDLVAQLRVSKAEYANTHDPIKQRTVWIDVLDCIMRTILEIPAVAHEGLLTPLAHLSTSLVDLRFGTADPALQPYRPAHRPPNPGRVRFRAHAAAASELLKRNGATAGDADTWVAKRLSSLGYRQPGSRGDTRITAVTIKGWRKAAREGSRGEVMRDTFELWMRSDVQWEIDRFRILDPHLEHDKEERLANLEHSEMVPALMVIEFIRRDFSPMERRQIGL